MGVSILKLTVKDVESVDGLTKENSGTLAFLPMEALKQYLEKGQVLGAKTDGGKLAGFILYSAHSKYFRIVNLCVSKDFRAQGIARCLVNELKKRAAAQRKKSVQLYCRRDFDAHGMWKKLGFISLGEKPGRAAKGSVLTFWCLNLEPDDQLSLFQTQTSGESLDVAIDSQVFFDFQEEDSDKSQPSKSLLSDCLVDSFQLFVTGELFNEITRSNDPQRREVSRARADGFPKLTYETNLMERFERSLKTILPSRNESQQSDIRHLAQTAASEIGVFVTRDSGLLRKRKREEILNLTGIQVVSPTELILESHQISDRNSYSHANVSGINIFWKRLTAEDLRDDILDSFLEQGERRGAFRQNLESFASRPENYFCELLRSETQPVLIRVFSKNAGEPCDVFSIHLCRVAKGVNHSLYEPYLVIDTICKAIQRGRCVMVKFEKNCVHSRFVKHLLSMGFVECDNGDYLRFCFPVCATRGQMLSAINGLCPAIASKFNDMEDLEIERRCSPIDLESGENKYFLIPIKSNYAMNLFDTKQAGANLFGVIGVNLNVLLRWENVYYKTKSHHCMLQPPARILWYQSGKEGAVTAVSHLDEVKIDVPKILFQQFKKFGVLEWKEIWEMCKNKTSTEIMALKFSNTFVFPRRASLTDLRKIFDEDGVGLSLQGPLKILHTTFQKIFKLGYSE